MTNVVIRQPFRLFTYAVIDVIVPSLMMNRAHDSKIRKKHLFFSCTDSPIAKYNCLFDTLLYLSIELLSF